MRRHRRCIVLRGSREETRAAALDLLRDLDDEAALWVSVGEETRFALARPVTVRRRLGQAFDAVVLDLHDGLDADVLGQCHGFVWGGGALVLRMPPRGARPAAGQSRLAVHPFEAPHVGFRFWDRFERCLASSSALATPRRLAAAPREVRGTDEQRRVVEQLTRRLDDPTPSLTALLSDRGRGKSSALGMALRAALEHTSLRVCVTAGHASQAAELLRFATGSPAPPAEGAVRFVTPLELLQGDEDPDVIVVDEAAQLPVPLLQRVVGRHPRARIAFASTTRGYEGTGRGFVLRFLEWAERQPRPLSLLHLTEPIRWEAGDPLERFVFDALALDAAPPTGAELEALGATAGEPEHVVVDRETLSRDETLLGDFFGLLVHAHYRTTPSDLHRVLDAPNLALHALVQGGRVVAATLVAREGDLPAQVCAQLARGRRRIRGHALPDTLISHSGRTDAGELRMVRSVRIAVHPELRRRGLGSALIAHVHRTYAPDLFGTLFGATPELLRFRRSTGYELVRVGISRGSRTGEPAAVMLRPVSERAVRLVEELRAELARDLPLALELLDAEGELGVEPALAAELETGLPPPAALSADARRAIMASYAFGPRPYESAAFAVRSYVQAHREALAHLDAPARALVQGRVLDRRAWARVSEAAGFETVPAAMRALRRALRAFALGVDPGIEEDANASH